MNKILNRILFLLLLLLPLISIIDVHNKGLVACEDEVEEEMDDDDEAVVDDGTGSQVEEAGEEEEEGDAGMKGSPDVDTVILFTKPTGEGKELPAGKLVEFLVGFTNNGDKDFVLDSIDASFRYPMDFSFYIQNFTAIPYHRSVKPRQEATLVYSFYPAEAFAGRPLGLSVNLAYHSADGDQFVEAIFNQTVSITEVEEGLDGETFFLYVFLLAFAVLLLLAGHHFLSSFGSKKATTVKKPTVETGTNIKDGIDYDWIPKELLNDINKGLVACEDEVEEEMDDDDEAVVDDGTGSQVEEAGEEEEEGDAGMKGSPDVDTVILFTKPTGEGKELPAGKLVEFLVGFTNNGDKDFVLDSIDASFRYPMDFSFYIQNFTAIPYHRSVKPRQEATLVYSFYPAEAFAGRPLGLSVNLAYHSADGDQFVEAIFNQTVSITEVEEGLDGETFFLYVFLLAFAVLLLLAGHHFLSSFGSKKATTVKKPTVETGTNIKDGIDYDWIPKELLNDIKKNQNPRSSPRSRKAKRDGGSSQ